MCIRVELNQTKNGRFALGLPVDEVLGAPRNSSSTVGMRVVFSGPVSSIFPSADGFDDAARAVLLTEFGILRIEIAFRLLFGVEMIEIAEELVEAVLGGQMFVAVAEMVLAELAGGIALRLHDVGDRRHPVLDTMGIARHTDRQKPGAERLLAENEGSAAGGAALLAVAVGEDRTLARDAVDVGRAIAHHAPSCRR